MAEELRGAQALEKMRELIKEIDIGMMTTRGKDTSFRSRPMSANGDVGEDGTLWFFTRKDSRLIDELQTSPDVLVSFSHPGRHIYVSVTGKAALTTERAVIERHWKAPLKAWFPGGIDDPQVILIRVTLQEGEYWDSNAGFIAHALSFTSSMISGEPMDSGEHGVVKPHIL